MEINSNACRKNSANATSRNNGKITVKERPVARTIKKKETERERKRKKALD